MKIAPARTRDEIAQCYALREAVFMGEQGVSAGDEWDGLDPTCTHFLATGPAGAMATARLLSKGDMIKIQRVAVIGQARGTGLGRELMRAVLDHARNSAFTGAVLDAQIAVVGFYERLGFCAEGPEFDDGTGILHRHMVLRFQPANRPE